MTTDPDHGTTVAERLTNLERRLREVEDRLELTQIIAAYGPAVDSGSAEPAADIWTADGVYDVYPTVLHGRDALRGMVTGDMHQGLITSGAAHLQGIPHVVVDGDRATVTHYSQLVLRNHDDSDTFRIWRSGVNVWHFVRTASGWKATSRINRTLDGGANGREGMRLLADAIGASPDPTD